jgi:hypothetical protein
LAALNLPRSQIDAIEALRYPMDFRMCAFCGHVWNIQFDYTRIPYAEDSNLMYNNGGAWQEHLCDIGRLAFKYRDVWHNKVAIDIGCGDGQFFSLLKKWAPDEKFLGFEPGIEAKKITDFEVVQDYFVPERDIKRYQPGLIVCRHVIEHLEQPRDFIAEIAYWSLQYDLKPVCIYEVPSFSHALELGRCGDYLYEHVSNFNCRSLSTMLSTSSYVLNSVDSYYSGEVLVACVTPSNFGIKVIKKRFDAFEDKWQSQLTNVPVALAQLQKEYPVLAFWGGTGKGATFLNLFSINCDQFPIVIDSDKNKAGRFVPGTGQLIRYAGDIEQIKPDAIVITTPWRTQDICLELTARGITCPVFTLRQQTIQRVQ